MELLKSFGAILWGIIKRIYWLAPALFTDPFDVAERWFKVTFVSPPWLVWVLVAVGFTVAITLTHHELRMQKVNADQQIKNLLDAKPSIDVFCETYYGNLCVVNNGNIADFRAKAQQIEEEPLIGKDWFITWEGSLAKDQTIYKGDSHILEVASCEWTYSMIGGVQDKKPHIRFYKAQKPAIDPDTGEAFILHHDLPSRYTSVEVEIRIFSQPDLRSPFKRRYLLKLIPDDDTVSIEEILTGASDEL